MGRDVDRTLQMSKWILAGVLAWWGSLPGLVHALLALQALDVAGGLLIASSHSDPGRRISSRRFGEGWRRKAYMWLIILGVYTLERHLIGEFPPLVGNARPSDVVAVGFIFMEAISLVENGILLGLPVPGWLVTMLAEGRKRFGVVQDGGGGTDGTA